jgi:hypothetical protein
MSVDMRRRRFSRAEKKAYEISNALFDVDFAVTPSMRRKVEDLARWLAAGDKNQVKAATQAVLDLLCEAARLPAATLQLKDTAYAKFRNGRVAWKLYGTCDRDGTITVAFKTPVRRRPFAFRTYLNTVVHEFMHHYDHWKLKLSASFHTSGFYHRVRHLYTRLLEGIDAPPPGPWANRETRA